MSTSVETMIRTHLQANDAVQETVEWVEIAARLETEPVQIVGPVATPVELRQRRWRPIAVAVAAVLFLVGGMALLFQVTEPDTPVADTVVPTTLAATDTAAQGEDAAVSVTGHLVSFYWHGPGATDGRIEMSDERLSGDVTFIISVDAWGETGTESALHWGTMVIENDGGTWEGTHFAADHHSRPWVHGQLVMLLVGSGDYEGLSAILYETVISSPGDAFAEESVDGMIFPGDLPPDRT